MSGGSHVRAPEPDDEGSRRGPRAPAFLRRPQTRRASGAWRIGTPAVILLCGGLFVVSAVNSGGTDLRPGRYTDLASLVQDESDQYDGLRQRITDLDAEVQTMSASLSDREVNRFHRRIAELEDPAGLVPRTGPGVSITLSDAPEDVINATTGSVNPLLVHQQDIQAVVNALWRGGATAVTVAGQRIVSTTGIKCEGNAVQLQGVPYPQPYVIEAVGDPGSLLTSIEDDDYLQAYREQAADPAISVGWDLELEPTVVAPGYDGLLDLSYAVPLDASVTSD